MRHAHHGADVRTRRALRLSRAPLALGVLAALVGTTQTAEAQVGSANVPLPNVLLLLDTSGSFEHMIDGSNPEDAANNNATSTPPQYANCELAWKNNVAATPNRWGVELQALTGTVLNASNAPYYSCVTMDRAMGSPSLTAGGAGNGGLASVLNTATGAGNGLDYQYGLRDGLGKFYYPYDGGYYLPYHRPVGQSSGGRCVYSPNVLPGATSPAGVGLTGGAPSNTDCAGSACVATDFPNDAIGTFLYDSYPTWVNGSTALPSPLPTPNFGFSSNTTSCVFNQATDGIIDQASTLVRFGLMTYDNDPSGGIGVTSGMVPTAPYFTGQWSYFQNWSTTGTPASGAPAGCDAGTIFELGARNPAAPPWEGRLIGFPSPNADVLATATANAQIQTAIGALRPYGATPTAALMTDAAYYFWADPNGPSTDPYVTGSCRNQYIILLTDGSPNQDLRPSCQNGTCPYHFPEEIASMLATNSGDTGGVSATGKLPAPKGNVYTYVIGFAVSGDNVVNPDAGVPSGTLANCANLAASGALAATCSTTTTPTDTSLTASTTNESPCCVLQRIAVAGGTQQAYFADTPGDLDAALAAVLGSIEGQLGSRTIPVPSPAVVYNSSGAAVSSTFVSTFQGGACTTPPCVTGGPWTGDVQRQEYLCAGGGTAASSPLTPPAASDDFGADLASQGPSARNFLFFDAWGGASGAVMSTNALTIRPYLNTANTITDGSGTLPTTADGLDTFGSNGQSGTEVNNFRAGSITAILQELTSNTVGTACTASGCPALGLPAYACQDPALRTYADPATCAYLAVAFATGQSTVSTAGGLGGDPNAATNLVSQFVSGKDGNNQAPATGGTNRASHPLGAILDSTPAVVGPPAAQVRDDSYQAFSMALAPNATAMKTNPRNPMLYVATVDGLLHAFDTTAGLGAVTSATAKQVEAWAFVPPAVLPHLMSNYPGANNILLDGPPVVKDVVFSRTTGTAQKIPWTQEWHTMLVSGFGAGGRGYYALDVTDPRLPTAADKAATSFAAYPTYVTSASNATLTGPHFQWQITSANLAGVNATTFPSGIATTELFGKISGTPAIATVYADPTLPTGTGKPQEIGIAILPGGRDGEPYAPGTCARELTTGTTYQTSAATYSSMATAAGLTTTSAYNLTDSSFRPRYNVRQWSPNCRATASTNPTTNPALANVPGRSVTIVSVATGQVLAVFARAKPTLTTWDSTAWDIPTDAAGNPVVASKYLIPTPLDSPMTGTPVVYPSGVGVVAQAVYIGDADGTMWRFDISDPNPANWTGAIFADAYSPAVDPSGSSVDTAGANPSSPDWTALDSQAISVAPVLALDSTATLTMNFATGDQTAFTACYSVPGLAPSKQSGTTPHSCAAPLQPTVNYVYSVAEARTSSGLPTARVNWYSMWTTGERVTGPMAVFNNDLYFATYVPPTTSGTSQCTQGGPNLYGWDFAKPASCASGVSCGGIPDTTFGNASGIITTTNLVTNTSSAAASVLANTIIPGVSVVATQACTSTNSSAIDGLSGTQTNVTAATSGTYSLVANIGKGTALGATGNTNLVTQKVKAPTAPTIVDSWAGIAE